MTTTSSTSTMGWFLLWRAKRRLKPFLVDGEAILDWDVISVDVPAFGTTRVYVTTHALHLLPLIARTKVVTMYFHNVSATSWTPSDFAFRLKGKRELFEFSARRLPPQLLPAAGGSARAPRWAR